MIDPDPFFTLLETGSPELRQRSAEVLADVPDLDAARLVLLLGDGDGANRAVAELLSRCGERAVPELLLALASGRDELRDGAVLVLSGMGPAAWPALVPRLRDPLRSVRLGAAMALQASGWAPADVEEAFGLRSALGDWDAVIGLGPAAVPFLIRALADLHPAVREAAARTLGRCGDARAVSPLIDLLAEDPDEDVRAAAATGLGRLGDPRGIPGLGAALLDRSCEVRGAAAAALESLGWRPETDDERVALLIAKGQWTALRWLGEAAIPTLIKALGDDYYGVRRDAAGVLLALGPVARAGLERARTDPDAAVRDGAVAILARMGPTPPTGGEPPAEPGE